MFYFFLVILIYLDFYCGKKICAKTSQNIINIIAIESEKNHIYSLCSINKNNYITLVLFIKPKNVYSDHGCPQNLFLLLTFLKFHENFLND